MGHWLGLQQELIRFSGRPGLSVLSDLPFHVCWAGTGSSRTLVTAPPVVRLMGIVPCEMYAWQLTRACWLGSLARTCVSSNQGQRDLSRSSSENHVGPGFSAASVILYWNMVGMSVLGSLESSLGPGSSNVKTTAGKSSAAALARHARQSRSRRGRMMARFIPGPH